jgi:hypothetical protein
MTLVPRTGDLGQACGEEIFMCRVITCSQCQRPTWAGCGAHVEQVLGHVPAADRCQCRTAAGGESGGKLGRMIRALFGR